MKQALDEFCLLGGVSLGTDDCRDGLVEGVYLLWLQVRDYVVDATDYVLDEAVGRTAL